MSRKTVQFSFILSNVPASATTNMTTFNAASGYKVPAGFDFYPEFCFAASNAALTAGSLIFKCTDDTVAISGGPEVTLNSSTQNDTAQQTLSAKVTENSIIGVHVVADASFLPTTADVDCMLVGFLIPSS